MADILPFVATRYSEPYEARLSNLITPPYDVIDERLQQELYERDDRNFVRIDYGKRGSCKVVVRFGSVDELERIYRSLSG